MEAGELEAEIFLAAHAEVEALDRLAGRAFIKLSVAAMTTTRFEVAASKPMSQ